MCRMVIRECRCWYTGRDASLEMMCAQGAPFSPGHRVLFFEPCVTFLTESPAQTVRALGLVIPLSALLPAYSIPMVTAPSPAWERPCGDNAHTSHLEMPVCAVCSGHGVTPLVRSMTRITRNSLYNRGAVIQRSHVTRLRQSRHVFRKTAIVNGEGLDEEREQRTVYMVASQDS